MSTLPASHQRFFFGAFGCFAVVWTWLAIAPLYRDDWLLENVLVFLLVPVIVFTYRRLPLSRISYCCIFLFLCLHEVGAHYTYAEVPYQAWWERWFGEPLGGRNHYDRLVHFLYGLLITYPIREIFLRIADSRGFWGYLFPLLVIMSTSMIFELFEWAAALIFGGELGMAYLGSQGDVWDAHKDMWLATVGALIATAIIAAINIVLDRDFNREWTDSLRVKHSEPLGEDEIARLLDEKRDGRHR
ncbi:MAG: DUF2238 domain-containing protein [Pseudomonadota bacterium]